MKPVLTVMLTPTTSDEIRASGVSADEDVFREATFVNLDEATHYLLRRYSLKYRIILHMPPEKEEH